MSGRSQVSQIAARFVATVVWHLAKLVAAPKTYASCLESRLAMRRLPLGQRQQRLFEDFRCTSSRMAMHARPAPAANPAQELAHWDEEICRHAADNPSGTFWRPMSPDPARLCELFAKQ